MSKNAQHELPETAQVIVPVWWLREVLGGTLGKAKALMPDRVAVPKPAVAKDRLRPAPGCVNPTAAARFLGVVDGTVYGLIERGKLPARRVLASYSKTGETYAIQEDDLQKFAETYDPSVYRARTEKGRRAGKRFVHRAPVGSLSLRTAAKEIGGISANSLARLAHLGKIPARKYIGTVGHSGGKWAVSQADLSQIRGYLASVAAARKTGSTGGLSLIHI